MSYSERDWRGRIAERTDMSTGLVHLTRETATKSAADVLVQIIRDRRLVGSTTESGFICGTRPAVCFQDAPLSSICQNIFFEQKKLESGETSKVRYRGIGLMFPKAYVYQKGGRPVIYEKTEQAKLLLPKTEWWRIVSLDLNSTENIIDWTHEREWRVPDFFEFDLSVATVFSFNNGEMISLSKSYAEWEGFDLRDEVAGVVTLESLLY